MDYKFSEPKSESKLDGIKTAGPPPRTSNLLSKPVIRKTFDPTQNEGKSSLLSKSKLNDDIKLKPLTESKESNRLEPVKPSINSRDFLSKPKYIKYNIIINSIDLH